MSVENNGNQMDGEGAVFKGWNEYPRFLEGKANWNWHNLRHRRASIWASSGMTTFEIMTRLGHANLQTTMKYLQLLGFSQCCPVRKLQYQTKRQNPPSPPFFKGGKYYALPVFVSNGCASPFEKGGLRGIYESMLLRLVRMQYLNRTTLGFSRLQKI